MQIPSVIGQSAAAAELVQIAHSDILAESLVSQFNVFGWCKWGLKSKSKPKKAFSF